MVRIPRKQDADFVVVDPGTGVDTREISVAEAAKQGLELHDGSCVVPWGDGQSAVVHAKLHVTAQMWVLTYVRPA
jgi:hypothetical protein